MGSAALVGHGDRLSAWRTVRAAMDRPRSRPRHRHHRAQRRPNQGRRTGKATKTGQKRRLALDTHTIDLLKAYRELCEKQCNSLGVTLARSAFVFSTSPDFATPRRPDSITQRYRRLAERNNLRSTRLHALRHYSATELLTAGIDVRTVAGRLGHGSGGATTLRFYAAWVNEADKKAANAIADIIPRPNPLLPRAPRSPYELLAL